MEPGPQPGAGRQRLVYAVLVALLVLAVALLRWDLVAQAFHVTMRQMGRGWGVRLKLLAEVALFSGILLFSFKAIPERAQPRKDVALALAAAVLGLAAEAWGTRLGLWTYYTKEAPPLWIVPAWLMGALVIDRVAACAREAAGPRLDERAWAAGFWVLACAVAAYVLAFAARSGLGALAWAGALAACAGLFVFPRPAADFWPLAAGLLLVFFADLWGVTNNCWAYYTQAGRSAAGQAAGIAFGMTFDAAVVLACFKASRLAGLSVESISKNGP